MKFQNNLPMNRTHKLLEMNEATESGSWAVSRSERNRKLSMNLPLSRPAATLSPAQSGGEGRERGRLLVQGFDARKGFREILSQRERAGVREKVSDDLRAR